MRNFIRGNVYAAIAGMAILALPVVYPNDYAINVMGLIGIYAMLALGMSLLLGYAGQISLGHAAFFGIGAYTTALLTVRWHQPVLLAFVASILFTALAAYLVGLPVLQLQGYFLAVATLGLGEIFVIFVTQARWLTKGSLGVSGVPWLEVGDFRFDTYTRLYYLIWLLLMVLVLFSQGVVRSRVGRALRAISVNEEAAAILGIPIAGYKLQVFVLSAAFAGVAGSLYAYFISAISPSSFSAQLSILIVMMVIIGGMGNIYGAIAGAAFITWLSQILSRYQQYSLSVYGALLIILLIFMPDGLVQGLVSLRSGSSRYLLRLLSRQEARPVVPTAHAIPWPAPHPHADQTISTQAENREQNKPDSILVLEALCKDFGGLRALDHVSLRVPNGGIKALIGPNGAGKSTLFNLVSGLQRPTAGQIWFSDQDITHLAPERVATLGLARTFQIHRVFDNMSVLENVMTGRHLCSHTHLLAAGLHLPWTQRDEQQTCEDAWELLEFMGLAARATMPVTSLAYGEQRLVELARALATEPTLLLLDEPAGGLNYAERKWLAEKICNIRDLGITIFLVEHDIGLVMDISDEVVVLNYGRIIAEGSPVNIRQDPEVIRAYLGKVEEPLRAAS